MSAEENKATMLRAIDELNKGNLDFIDEGFSPNFAVVLPTCRGPVRNSTGNCSDASSQRA